MEIFTTSIMHLPEILIAVMTVLGGQKGFEIYRRKRYSNGGRDRRSNSGSSNSFCQSDKDFIAGCFESQTRELGTSMENDRLKLMIGFKEVVQTEGEKTRVVVRSSK